MQRGTYEILTVSVKIVNIDVNILFQVLVHLFNDITWGCSGVSVGCPNASGIRASRNCCRPPFGQPKILKFE